MIQRPPAIVSASRREIRDAAAALRRTPRGAAMAYRAIETLIDRLDRSSPSRMRLCSRFARCQVARVTRRARYRRETRRYRARAREIKPTQCQDAV